jgi:hypothetical protein
MPEPAPNAVIALELLVVAVTSAIYFTSLNKNLFDVVKQIQLADLGKAALCGF